MNRGVLSMEKTKIRQILIDLELWDNSLMYRTYDGFESMKVNLFFENFVFAMRGKDFKSFYRAILQNKKDKERMESFIAISMAGVSGSVTRLIK
jgi:uncharacterized protein (UPF0303 family)